MEQTNDIDQKLIDKWLKERYSIEKIKEYLRQNISDNDDIILKYISQFQKQFSARQHTRGFIIMAVGAFIGFISCLLSIINPFPEIYFFSLYGLTSIAICVVMLGLYFVFEY